MTSHTMMRWDKVQNVVSIWFMVTNFLHTQITTSSPW